MILPIVAYGHPVLRKVAVDITQDYPQLDKLIADMWETMYNSNGVGLAAPQINRDIRLFVMDTEQMFEGRKGISCFDSTVVSPVAMICNGSVTARPVRLPP